MLAPGPFFATTALYAPLLRAIGVEAGAGVGTVALPDHPYVLEAERADVVAVVEPGPSGAQVRVIERPPARFVATIDSSRRLYSVDAGSRRGNADQQRADQQRADQRRADHG